MNLPRPASHVWAEWMNILTPAQRRVVSAWKGSGYNEFLSPKTCWYLLCGKKNPAERAKRRAALTAAATE